MPDNLSLLQQQRCIPYSLQNGASVADPYSSSTVTLHTIIIIIIIIIICVYKPALFSPHLQYTMEASDLTLRKYALNWMIIKLVLTNGFYEIDLAIVYGQILP